jgi:hypothetical protein
MNDKRKQGLSTRDIASTPGEIDQQQPADRDAPMSREMQDESPLESLRDPGTEATALLPADQSGDFERRWQDIQVAFVDQPRESVQQADQLVADLMQQLADGFAQERGRLEGQWDRGDDVSTEELRVALTRYRSFFNRLLSA